MTNRLSLLKHIVLLKKKKEKKKIATKTACYPHYHHKNRFFQFTVCSLSNKTQFQLSTNYHAVHGNVCNDKKLEPPKKYLGSKFSRKRSGG